jgi:signal recognition particle subunit SEC65
MPHDPSKMSIWTGYFDSRLSRSAGRRVPKEASVPNPTLETVAWAAKAVGISKMKRETDASHPSRPHLSEGRLVLSRQDALSATNAESKEGVMQTIGLRLRSQAKEAKEQEGKERARGPSKGDRQRRAQRKSFKQKGGSRRKKFGR